MPKIPKLIGDLIEYSFSSKFGKVKVDSIILLSTNVKLIRFKGKLPDVNFNIGQAILIRINDNNYRNYTPSTWNAGLGIVEIIFHLHGNGPGSRFIDQLQLDDEIRISMPRGFNVYRKEMKYHFLFGDESCIGVFRSLKDEINLNDQNYLGILELDNSSSHVPESNGLQVDVVAKSANKAAFAIDNLNNLDSKIWRLWQSGFFYLMGNAASIQNFRKALKDKGVSSKQIYTQPFWADGKIGL